MHVHDWRLSQWLILTLVLQALCLGTWWTAHFLWLIFCPHAHISFPWKWICSLEFCAVVLRFWGWERLGNVFRSGNSLAERVWVPQRIKKNIYSPRKPFSLSGELTAKPPREWFQWIKLGFNKCFGFQIEIPSVWNEKIKRKVKMYELFDLFFFML